MGMDAIVFGCGPFKQELLKKNLLPYPDDWYKDIPEGQIICGILCTMPTSDSSRMLARCLGVDIDSMYWVVRSDQIDPDPALELWGPERDNMIKVVEELKIFVDNGWKLYFDPCA